MKEFDYGDIEIVALNESITANSDSTVSVECGRSLPFVRHKPTNRFFLLSGTSQVAEGDRLLEKDEIEEWARDGRLTLLSEPVPAFPGAVVVYVFRSLVSAAEFELSAPFEGEEIEWSPLYPESTDIMFACLTEQASEHLMNFWAKLLMEKSNNLLLRYFSNGDSSECEKAEYFLSMARAAARERLLRERIYLRHGVALLSLKKLDSLQALQRTIKHSFPGWKEETFREQVRNFIVLARMRAAAFTSTELGSGRVSANSQEARQKAAEVVLRGALIISENQNETERRQLGGSAAQEYQDLYGVDADVIAKAVKATEKTRQTEDPMLILDDEISSAYAAEPAIHNPGVLSKQADGETLAVNVLFFLIRVLEYRKAGIKQGEVANRLAMKAVV